MTKIVRYFKGSETVWALVRRGYLAGETARVLAERYGPSRHTIHKRAQQKGWTKKALKEAQDAEPLRPPPVRIQGPESDQEPVRQAEPASPREAAVAAAGRAAAEMFAGRPVAAVEFARLAEALARVADRLGPVHAAEAETDDGEDILTVLKARLADLRAGSADKDPAAHS